MDRTPHEEPSILAAYAERVLHLAKTKLPDEYFYAGVPQCVIDAVFSIAVRYEGVRHVVSNYCTHFAVPRFRTDRGAVPPPEQQDSVASLCGRFATLGVETMTTDVFRNRQRTSSRNGILKSEAVRRFALALHERGVDHFQDLPTVRDDPEFAAAILCIPGQGTGISLRYFWMLTGSDQFVKPDRMVQRFLRAALGREVALPEEATHLLQSATELLRVRFPDLTPRALDYKIWEHQRTEGRTSPPLS